jgi:sulfur carrier protein
MGVKVTVFANGKARQVESDQTVEEMVRQMKLAPSSVLVERNGEALLRQEWGERKVEHGDRLEIVRVVAGG